MLNPNGGCTCMTVWNSILPPPPCPVHNRPDWRAVLHAVGVTQ